MEFSDTTTWAAWLYYVDGMTQSDVAKVIGVSRVTVMKLLNDARDSGIVSVRFDPRSMAAVTVSRRLAAEFGLASAMVLPDNPDRPLTERLGKAAALAIVEDLRPDDVIGVAWGRTVLAAAQNLSLATRVPNLTVVQVAASPNGLSAEFSPELCSSLFANRLGARSINLLTPGIVSSPELRAMLLAEPSIRNQLDIIRSANKVVFGVGQLTKGATIRGSDLHSEQTLETVIGQGAVAAIMGQFLDAHGHEMTGPTQDRTIGISLDEFKAIPRRLCVAGGPEKVRAILVALRGGFATDLIIDLPTAQTLLDQMGDGAVPAPA
ncbi:MAG: sugar-binding transcriptional regulator [Gemmobacter sp.]